MENTNNIRPNAYQFAPYESPPQKPRTRFNKADYMAVFTVLLSAWSYIWGYDVFKDWYWIAFAAFYVGANFLYAGMKKNTISVESFVYAVFVLAAGVCLTLVSYKQVFEEVADGFVFPLMIFYHGFGIYFVLTLNRNRIDNCLNERGIFDMLRGVFVIPLTHFHRMVQAAVNGIAALIPKAGKEGHRNPGKIKQVALGIGIGSIIILIAVPLLMAAEKSFYDFMYTVAGGVIDAITNFFNIFRFENIAMIIVAFYLYGLSYGAGKTSIPIMNKSVPKYTLAAIICQAAACGLYFLFFAVKMADVISTVSKGYGTFIYSEYARRGFFELCGIAFLNILIYYLIRYMADWDNIKNKILSTILCFETIGFVVLALYKMSMYINIYGITFKRVFSSWFMLVVLVGFGLFICQTWVKFNAIRITIWFGAVSFLGVAFYWCV